MEVPKKLAKISDFNRKSFNCGMKNLIIPQICSHSDRIECENLKFSFVYWQLTYTLNNTYCLGRSMSHLASITKVSIWFGCCCIEKNVCACCSYFVTLMRQTSMVYNTVASLVYSLLYWTANDLSSKLSGEKKNAFKLIETHTIH